MGNCLNMLMLLQMMGNLTHINYVIFAWLQRLRRGSSKVND